jgi:hypothetical protein
MLQTNKTIRFPLEIEIKEDLFNVVEEDAINKIQLLKSEVTNIELLLDFNICRDIKYVALTYLIETMPFDKDLFALLGTSPFGFKHPKYVNYTKNDGYLIYDIISNSKEIEIINMLQDDNTTFQVERENGIETIFNNKKTFIWTYEREEENGYPVYFIILANENEIKTYEGLKLNISNIEVI